MADLTNQLWAKFGAPPPALRFFAQSLAGATSPITERDFTPQELAVLRDAANRGLAKGEYGGKYGYAPNTFGYGDYAPGGEKAFTDYGGNSSVYHALTDLPSSLSFTIGMANANRGQDGSMNIKDRYDFAASKQEVDALKARGILSMAGMLAKGFAQNGLLGVGNVLGNLSANEGAGRDVSINIPAPSGILRPAAP